MFSGLFSPTLHLSRVTEAMPSLTSGQILHVFNAHMPNKQHVAFPSGHVRRASRNGSLADLSSCCSAYKKTSAGEKARNRNHFRHLQCGHLYLSQSPQALVSIPGEKYVLLTHRSSELLQMFALGQEICPWTPITILPGSPLTLRGAWRDKFMCRCL